MTRQELIANAHSKVRLAQQADNTWQAALDHFGIDRWSLRARMYAGLNELYLAKVEADKEMIEAMRKAA